MVINENCIPGHVKFVSYTGSYPCLCSGTLTLDIDGEVMRFGNDGGAESFWESGGFIDSNYDAEQSEWVIDVIKLPENIRKYVSEIDRVFNENVPYGCCGGCI